MKITHAQYMLIGCYWMDGWNLIVIRPTSKQAWKWLNLNHLFVLLDDNEKNLSLGLQTLRSLKVRLTPLTP